MSLESQVAALVTASNTLTNEVTGKKAAIDASVAAAVAAVPNLEATIYVDNVAGVDTNAGTQANPVKTINEALTRTKPVTNIYLMAGQTHTLSKNSPLLSGVTLIILKYGPASTKPILTQLTSTNTSINKQNSFGITIKNSTIQFNNINIVTAINPTSLLIQGFSSGIVSMFGNPNNNIQLEFCDILLQDFNFYTQADGRQSTSFLLYKTTISRLSPAGLTSRLCEINANSVGMIGQSACILNSGLTWPDIIIGITKDANGALRNITTSIASL